jgi:YgiT-type zinc finger domain-containing protein
MVEKKRDDKCAICGGELHDALVTTIEDGVAKGEFVIVENVPAQECRKCGEQWFDIDTMQKLEAIVKSKIVVVKKIEVPVCDFAVIAA